MSEQSLQSSARELKELQRMSEEIAAEMVAIKKKINAEM